MSIDEIKEEIANALSAECDPGWQDVLNDTTPGHYGVWDVEFNITPDGISWVDVPMKTFKFKKTPLVFSARLGSSKEDDGVDARYEIGVSGNGSFEMNGSSIVVTDFSINEDLDLFGDNCKARPIQ